MGIRRWDAILVGAVAAASAAVFAGLGPRLAEAEGPAPVSQAKVQANGLIVPVFGGCQLSAKAAKVSFTPDEAATVTITATNPGASPATLALTVTAETMSLGDGKMMSRRIEMTYKKAAEQTVTLAVEPGKAETRTVTFKLPAGNYVIRAGDGKAGALLCSFVVAAPKVIAAQGAGKSS